MYLDRCELGSAASCHSVNINVSEFPHLLDGNRKAGGVHWCLIRMSAGKSMDIPIVETGASQNH